MQNGEKLKLIQLCLFTFFLFLWVVFSQYVSNKSKTPCSIDRSHIFLCQEKFRNPSMITEKSAKFEVFQLRGKNGGLKVTFKRKKLVTEAKYLHFGQDVCLWFVCWCSINVRTTIDNIYYPKKLYSFIFLRVAHFISQILKWFL